MPFDQKTRNLLQRTVTACRRIFDREFTAQLQELYGIQPDGSLTPLAELDHLSDEQLEVAALLRSRINHLDSGEPAEASSRTHTRPENVARVIREQAFTVLNRLAALRLCEERGLVLECVRQGVSSEGFQLFMTTAGSALGDTYDAYCVYLHCLFDELSSDLGVLFDRFSPLALLFPRKDALEEVLRELNGSGKAAYGETLVAEHFPEIWQADEAIGWIYQYYNDEAERKKMREESSAPRNSRELAVRNQFFTPRYGVEFLTDNTLGRLWYEMTHGETTLRDTCRYLVRRPTEIFLKVGEAEPTIDRSGAQSVANLSQEELLCQPVYIPHRQLKDPREIRLLDPACGSMHFGLYAFDLFSVIYNDAWEIAHSAEGAAKFGETFKSFATLISSFENKAAFLLDVPRLIIEHNIHGIDIDPRAAQIAALSLWLRAQRAWHQAGIAAADRPQITRSSIVCAEPMPGEKRMLRDFVDEQFELSERPAFAFLMEKIFDHMTLAGEAGSLLRIEEEIRSAIAEASKLARSRPIPKQVALFPGDEKPEPSQLELQGLIAEHFWEEAEQRIYAALEAYSEQAESGGGFQRRLFAKDAAQGFAFIDLCRKRYDVVLMNPPFGEAALATRGYVAASFPESKDDISAAFVDRGTKILSNGLLGVISNRTAFFLTGMRRWREKTLLASPSLSLLADLGDGVLDGALVEAAAYTLQTTTAPCAFFRLLDQSEKAGALLESTEAMSQGFVGRGCFVNHVTIFALFPESRVSYWAPPSVREIYRKLSGAQGRGLEVKFGLSTKDDWRFIRLRWEIPDRKVVASQDDATAERPWMYLAKGGEYSLYFADIHLVANWAHRGKEIGARVVQLYPYLNGDPNWVLHTEVPYGRPGVTYTKRTTSGFSPRMLPPGCLISDLGCTIFADDDAKLPRVLATYGSRAFGYLLEFNVASGDSVHSGSAARHYEIGTVASVPIPDVTSISQKAADDTVAIWKRKVAIDRRDETSRYFGMLPRIPSVSSLREYAAAVRNLDIAGFVDILAEASEAEQAVQRLYGFDAAAREACGAEFGPDVTTYSRSLTDEERQLISALWGTSISNLVADTARELGFARFISKMTFLSDRRLELICHRIQAHPQLVANVLRDIQATSEEAVTIAQDVFSYAFGAALGRWDIRFGSGARSEPDLPSPFVPLLVCPPGMLLGDDGLPLSIEEGRRRDAEDAYPLDVAWDGILVDDPEHPLDLERKVHTALGVLWGDRAELLEHEACTLIGEPHAREWFRRPTGFFADHLQRYSKSRRQAPIYWPLSTTTGRYTLWIYYHRITLDTLYKCLQLFVLPKLVDVEKELTHLRAVIAANEGGAKAGKRMEELEGLRRELIEFRTELELWAPRWKPNLNDGVLITAAPLWKLFRLPKWQKDLKTCWQELEKGDYDWAHLAYSLWPDRVRAKCKTDRSLAIAHNLEEICEVKVSIKKIKKAKIAKTTIEQQELPKD
jgi:hypothetical protein